ncbi:MAG: chromosome segregation protein SMC [Anaerolineales bacterium]|nr:chromosome segregation protein SMC [Anaerolineales bacterium]MBP6208936.1 chromosome segregation protein SMC [Anaerolineales bacterium]
MPLRLKSLELQGYKTFASRTVFEFASGITAIVGPNGSGKSNIADSLRWVLGEQSYTLLRGKKTEDMIFSGSEHRARAGMAQATITFDNTAQWLPVDFSEVALSRAAHRDGHNDYLINGQHVRLREMNELLAQAGLSERTYTILGQGLVDASLALKADDRRRLFEEAAGVGLYRSRRDDALKRLDDTERNLERVLDIMAELEPRIRSLERQAKRAIDFARVQADMKVTLREWYGYHWHRAQRDLTDIREAVRGQEIRVREARQVHENAQAEYAAFRERLSGLRAQLSGWHRQSAELHNQREAISRELAVLEERRRALTNTQASLLSDQEHAADELHLANDRFGEAEQDAARILSEYEEAKSQLANAQNSLHSRQSDRAELEEQLAQIRNQIEALSQQRAENNARLDELKSRIESQNQKIEQTKTAISNGETLLAKTKLQYESARGTREQAMLTLQEAEDRVIRKKDEVSGLDRQRREALEQRTKEESDHSRLKAQLEVLEQSEQSLAGYAEGARFLLEAARESKLSGARGALSAALDVPAELETAIAAALGDTLDAVLLDSNQLEEALSLLESDGAGRAALLPLDERNNLALSNPNDGDCLGVASELVKSPEELSGAVRLMLGQTLIASDRNAARRLIQNLPIHARVVTLRGEVFRGDGLIIAGKTASSSALSRPRRKREFEFALGELMTRIAESNELVERLSNQLAGAQRELAQFETDAREARVRLGECQETEQQAGLESESAQRQLEWQKNQLTQLEAEAQESASIQQRLIESQSEVEDRSADMQSQLKETAAKLAEISPDELQEQASYWGTRVAVAEQTVAGANAKKEERAKEIMRLDARRVELASRLQEAEQSLLGLDHEKARLREGESRLHVQIEEMRVLIDPVERDLETAEQEEKRLQEAEGTAQRVFANTERSFGQVQLEQTRKQEALDNLYQKITDDFGLVMFEYADDVSGPVPLPLDGMVEQLPVVTELAPEIEEQLTHHRAMLRRMGPINPDAKAEYEQESERYTFMKAQVEDLRKAQADLKQVVAELDEITKQEFVRTFDAVDKQFRETFVRLFGGGSARLALTDPENLVDTGIEIEARLPGRREQGLALLSGGERSLTAIALVFALLKVSPTPVCVMDEVDAMLDEANVGRFRDLLVDLSKDTQFIIITHNRNTVQAADVIYGVTMGRDSASQIISLRLDQVTDDMLKRG